ncbi:MAG: hypothetical protein ACPGU7_02980 [Gammaproteobacteria bacterium]
MDPDFDKPHYPGDAHNRKQVFKFLFGVVLGLPIIIFVASFATRFDLGDILRDDDASVEHFVRYHADSDIGTLWATFRERVRESGQRFKTFRLTEDGQLRIEQRFKVHRDGEILKGVSFLNVYLGDLETRAYATSLSNSQRHDDHWNIDLYCRDMRPCIQHGTDLWKTDTTSNQWSILADTPGYLKEEILALMHLLIERHGGASELEQTTHSHYQIESAYQDEAERTREARTNN